MKYSRLDRKKNPPTIWIKNKGSLLDAFDNAIKEVFLITDEEYDVLAEHMSREEIDLFIADKLAYKEAKQLVISINKHLDNQ